MRLNRRMHALLGDAPLSEIAATMLPAGLHQVLAEGWVAEPSGALVLRRLRDDTGLTPTGYPDLTGYEAAVNVVRIFDEDVAPDEEYTVAAVRVGLSFATAALRQFVDGSPARDATGAGTPLAVVTSGDDTSPVTVRFYVDRPGEPWLDEDLERYEQEGIAVLDVEDLPAG